MRPEILMIGAFVAVMGWVTYQFISSSYKSNIIERIKARLALINPHYGDLNITVGHSSATIDKSEISLCVADPTTGKEYPINTLMYVALHEVAHVVTPHNDEDAHGPTFSANFQKLLRAAAQKGVYNPTKEMPRTYCGI